MVIKLIVFLRKIYIINISIVGTISYSTLWRDGKQSWVQKYRRLRKNLNKHPLPSTVCLASCTTRSYAVSRILHFHSSSRRNYLKLLIRTVGYWDYLKKLKEPSRLQGWYVTFTFYIKRSISITNCISTDWKYELHFYLGNMQRAYDYIYLSTYNFNTNNLCMTWIASLDYYIPNWIAILDIIWLDIWLKYGINNLIWLFNEP